MPNVLPQLKFIATEPVRAALSAIGRTEDLRFSPDGGLLVLAGFIKKRCLVLRVRVDQTPEGPQVTADDFLELSSDGITMVHGIDFLAERTLALANRDGRVAIVQLPPGELAGRTAHVRALQRLRSTLLCRVKAPGSLVVRREPEGRIALLVCNTYINHVTRHVIDVESGFRVTESSLFLERSLKIPDGIAVSHDGHWIAVSGHHTNDVKMFATSAPLDKRSEPAGVLRDANFSHGVRFTADDQFVLVADAGSPQVSVYSRGEGWGGVHHRERSVVVLDDETFARGRVNQEEGGPKGIDIDRSNAVVATTCEAQTLAFFSLSQFTGIEHSS